MAEADLLEDATKLIESMRKDRSRQDRKSPLLPPFSDAERDSEDRYRLNRRDAPKANQSVRDWYVRAGLEQERLWNRDRDETPGRKLGTREPPKDDCREPPEDTAEMDALPTPQEGARGAPVRAVSSLSRVRCARAHAESCSIRSTTCCVVLNALEHMLSSMRSSLC